jgi:putative membrane protein
MEPRADPKPPDQKTDLAETRTVLAAERTLMAWIRTALGMISFGFGVYKFTHALGRAQETTGSRHLGIVFAVLGTTSLTAGTIEYARTLRSVQVRRPGVAFYVACGVILIGLLVLAGIAVRLGPLD